MSAVLLHPQNSTYIRVSRVYCSLFLYMASLAQWPAENVPVPRELRGRDGAGVKKLTKLLRDEFATSRQKNLYCIKFACSWPDYRSEYADLLGNLTAEDMEAITYHWQGRPDKRHNADSMLIRVQTSSLLEHAFCACHTETACMLKLVLTSSYILASLQTHF